MTLREDPFSSSQVRIAREEDGQHLKQNYGFMYLYFYTF